MLEQLKLRHGDYEPGHKVRYKAVNNKKGEYEMRYKGADFSRGNVQNINAPEEFDYPLWDRVNYPAAGASQLSFFALPRGQSATLIRAGVAASVTKTTRDTNLDTPNQINVSARTVRGISLNFIPLALDPTGANTDDVAEDIQNLLNGGYFQFKVGDKIVCESPLFNLPSFASVVGFAATATTAVATTTSIVSAANRGGDGTYQLRTPLTLNPTAPFTFVCNWDGTVAVSQPFDLVIQLHGVVRRPT